MAGDLTRVWTGQGRRVSYIEHEDGDLSLTVATDYDSGPAQTCRIPAAAVPFLSSAMLGVAWNRAIEQACSSVRRSLDMLQRTEEVAKDGRVL